MMNMLEKIRSLDPWFYNLKIGDIEVTPGIGSPHGSLELVERTAYMKELFFDNVIDKYDFKGKRLLDVGANCAYWSSLYVQQGAKSLVAMEGREKFIEQAKLYYYTNKLLPEENLNFVCGDVTSESVWDSVEKLGPYDFCLCCGILYHIVNHDLVLTKIVKQNPEAVLVDTRVSLPGEKHASVFEEVGDYKFDAIPTNRKAKHPTLEYLMSFFADNGYSVTNISIPNAIPKDNTMQGKDNYQLGKRVTLFCRKT